MTIEQVESKTTCLSKMSNIFCSNGKKIIKGGEGMGYILPITPYQSIQYAQRSQLKTYTLRTVQSVQPIVSLQNKRSSTLPLSSMNNYTHYRSRQDPQVIEQDIPKGTYINEKV